MTIRPVDQIAVWCADQEAATCDNAFGPDTNVYRVGQKIFALVNLDQDGFVTLKADPDDALALQQQHGFVRPGYYMNKRHWITVDVVPDLPMDHIRELIDDSYALVLGSLSRARRDDIKSQADT